MKDKFSQYYEKYQDGSYDCVDRIVLNAYEPLGQTPGGFRSMWRKWKGDDTELDKAHQAVPHSALARLICSKQ